MYEKRLKEISEKIGEESVRKFYILTHRKHGREVYFQNSKRAIKFIQGKFNISSKRFRRTKNIIYFLVKLGVLQPFLKKIKLSSKFGDVIYAANQIKGFDLINRTVISFPAYKKLEKDFIISKKFQMKIGKRGFAPKIFEFNEKFPYSKEEILKELEPECDSMFKRLNEFYQSIGIKRISSGKYLSELKKEIKNENVLNKLYVLSKKKFGVLITTLHGDVAKENILEKNGQLVFIDWSPYEGLIIDDLVNFFNNPRNSSSSEMFKSALEFYPEEVKKNIKLYLELSKIFLKLKKVNKTGRLLLIKHQHS